MELRKIVYYFSKITLIDEILGFLYWALAILGILLIVDRIGANLTTIIVLVVYIPLVTVTYILLSKALKRHLRPEKANQEDS